MVGAFDSAGNPTGDRADGNGGGIAVLSVPAPATHLGFPVTGPAAPGPADTLLLGNRVYGNRGYGVVLINATRFNSTMDEVEWNQLDGIYWIGSSGVIDRATVRNNEGDGVRVEPHFGSSAAPDGSDDVLPTPTDPAGLGITGSDLSGNGGYGIRVVDSPWANLSDLCSANSVTGNGLGSAVKLWLGYAVVSWRGRPMPGATVWLYRGGDDGDDVPDYVSGPADPQGRCGPPGFDYGDVSTWWLVEESEVDGSGNYLVYNPHSAAVNAARIRGTYSWDGAFPWPAGESGGAVEAPPGSGAWRYQYMAAALGAGGAGAGPGGRRGGRLRPPGRSLGGVGAEAVRRTGELDRAVWISLASGAAASLAALTVSRGRRGRRRSWGRDPPGRRIGRRPNRDPPP